ncbi:nitroreductase [Pseudonocardia sp. CNS-139]|nr:nitroreductase [Pseudonocardia sp. CNS-139]
MNTTKKPGGTRAFMLWIQRMMNARTNVRIRRGMSRSMGMDLLILHTTGRRSGQPRESPLTWFAEGDARLVVASGGGSRNPDWFMNLTAHPDAVAVEMPGDGGPVPVTAQVLDDTERERAWQHITTMQPRYAKYQGRSERKYPVVRLSPCP